MRLTLTRVPGRQRHRSVGDAQNATQDLFGFAGDDGQWKTLTVRANSAFAAKRWDKAESLYLEALTEADTVFRTWCEGHSAGTADPAPMLVKTVRRPSPYPPALEVVYPVL